MDLVYLTDNLRDIQNNKIYNNYTIIYVLFGIIITILEKNVLDCVRVGVVINLLAFEGGGINSRKCFHALTVLHNVITYYYC